MVGVDTLETGRVFPDHLLAANPAAGAGLVFPLDATWSWQIISARFLLATDANVANRFVSVDYCDNEGNAWIRNPALAVVPAGVAAQEFDFAPRNVPVSGIAGQPQFPELVPVWLPGGWQVRVNIGNVQAGDQLSAIRLYVLKYLAEPE